MKRRQLQVIRASLVRYLQQELPLLDLFEDRLAAIEETRALCMDIEASNKEAFERKEKRHAPAESPEPSPR